MQLSHVKAHEIAAQAADRALGFGPRKGRVTITAEEMAQVATLAALNALRAIGCLDEANKRESSRLTREVAEIRRKEAQYT